MTCKYNTKILIEREYSTVSIADLSYQYVLHVRKQRGKDKINTRKQKEKEMGVIAFFLRYFRTN